MATPCFPWKFLSFQAYSGRKSSNVDAQDDLEKAIAMRLQPIDDDNINISNDELESKGNYNDGFLDIEQTHDAENDNINVFNDKSKDNNNH